MITTTGIYLLTFNVYIKTNTLLVWHLVLQVLHIKKPRPHNIVNSFKYKVNSFVLTTSSTEDNYVVVIYKFLCNWTECLFSYTCFFSQ